MQLKLHFFIFENYNFAEILQLMEFIGYFCALIIGLVMGVIGGGGSILGVPVFVYIFKIGAVTATALSLFVVGTTSLVGSFGYMKQKLVNFKTALLFGIPSILGVVFSRRLVVPNLPEIIFNKLGFVLTKDMFLLILFAILMLISSYKMINKINEEPLKKSDETNYTLLISQGLLVGILTGLIGAGGGFLIVPALVMLLGMEIKQAIGTSLLIIAMNSLLGFFSAIDKVDINWQFLLIFTSLSVVGVFSGILISKKVNGKKLKPIFGWFILAMGIYIILKEIFFK